MLGRMFGLGSSPSYEESPTTETPVTVSGSLYVSTFTSEGSTQQRCMYMTCNSSVRPSSEEFSHELLISRDGEEAADENELVPPDVVFPIEKSSRFESQDQRIGWSDRAGKRYNLDIDDVESAESLRESISTALFQSIHHRIPGPEDKQALDDILKLPSLPSSSDLLEAKGELIRVSGHLYKYDIDAQTFQTVSPTVMITINAAVVKEDSSRAYLLIVYKPDSGDRILECEISNQMNAQFYTQTMSVVWVLDLDPEAGPDEQICLSVKFEDAEDYVRLRNQFSVCLYEVNHQASMDDLKLKEEDRAYIEDSIRDDVEPMDIDSEDESTEESNRNISEASPASRPSVGDIDDGLRNSQLAIGANIDRTFVVRGNKMGVFAADDTSAQFKQTINFKDPKSGSLFTPSTILLHQQDRSMIVLDSQDDTKMMRMDLERGEIVDTWAGGLTKNTPVKAVQRVKKYANLTDTQEFVGLNKNQLLRMDPRTSEFIVQSKRYAAGTRARLDSVATTGAGYLAVASENGDIRLYDQIGKNAKTHLPGLGDRIIGIDVSEDGSYVLATTAQYLLVIDTRVKDEAKGGFQKSMGKKKPVPRKLTIRNQDIIKYRMGTVSFTTAHFNTGSSLERSIVTSTGPFVVIWNFRSVKMGRLENYKIRRYEDTIVADDFAYDNDGRVVVTLPNQVSVARR